MGDLLLGHFLVDHGERQTGRHDAEQDDTANSGVDDAGVFLIVTVFIKQHFRQAHLDAGLQVSCAGIESFQNFILVGKDHALTLGIHTGAGHVIQTQYHVL